MGQQGHSASVNCYIRGRWQRSPVTGEYRRVGGQIHCVVAGARHRLPYVMHGKGLLVVAGHHHPHRGGGGD